MIEVTVFDLKNNTIANARWLISNEASNWVSAQIVNNSWGKPGTYTVTQEDITAKLAAEQAKLDAAVAARALTKTAIIDAKANPARTLAEANLLLDKIIDYLGIGTATDTLVKGPQDG